MISLPSIACNIIYIMYMIYQMHNMRHNIQRHGKERTRSTEYIKFNKTGIQSVKKGRENGDILSSNIYFDVPHSTRLNFVLNLKHTTVNYQSQINRVFLLGNS